MSSGRSRCYRTAMQPILAESGPSRGRALAILVVLAVLTLAIFASSTVRRHHVRYHTTQLRVVKLPSGHYYVPVRLGQPGCKVLKPKPAAAPTSEPQPRGLR